MRQVKAVRKQGHQDNETAVAASGWGEQSNRVCKEATIVKRSDRQLSELRIKSIKAVRSRGGWRLSVVNSKEPERLGKPMRCQGDRTRITSESANGKPDQAIGKQS